MQLTTVGHKTYLDGVEGALGADIDSAILIKHYAAPVGALGRYSPGECTGTELRRVQGRLYSQHPSTSYVERQNLTMRTSMRRFIRLMKAFSKKAENHAHIGALYTIRYNFVFQHKTLGVALAMAAGLSDKLWSMKIVALVNAAADAKAKRGS